MNQTTLNIIAVSVFSLTLSSLLGPLLNIPPAIPAVLAFCMLGIVTIDNLSWQGQLGTLLMEKLAGVSPEHRQRVIHHEAGHFLVAYLLGIPVTSYALTAWEAMKQGQSAQGGVRFDDAKLNSELQTGKLSVNSLELYAKIWMAGIAAEKFVYGKSQGGAEDRQKLLAVYSQLGMASQAEIKARWAILQATNLIEINQKAYQSLVDAMKENLPIEVCCRLIEENKS